MFGVFGLGSMVSVFRVYGFQEPLKCSFQGYLTLSLRVSLKVLLRVPLRVRSGAV